MCALIWVGCVCGGAEEDVQFGTWPKGPPTTAEIQTIVVSDAIVSYSHGWTICYNSFPSLKFRHQLIGIG